MNASDWGSADWWVVVRTSPLQDALQRLHDYKSELLNVTVGHPEYITTSAKLQKVNQEIKRYNERLDSSRWYKACKEVLTPDDFDAVCVRKRMLEMEKV